MQYVGKILNCWTRRERGQRSTTPANCARKTSFVSCRVCRFFHFFFIAYVYTCVSTCIRRDEWPKAALLCFAANKGGTCYCVKVSRQSAIDIKGTRHPAAASAITNQSRQHRQHTQPETRWHQQCLSSSSSFCLSPSSSANCQQQWLMNSIKTPAAAPLPNRAAEMVASSSILVLMLLPSPRRTIIFSPIRGGHHLWDRLESVINLTSIRSSSSLILTSATISIASYVNNQNSIIDPTISMN